MGLHAALCLMLAARLRQHGQHACTSLRPLVLSTNPCCTLAYNAGDNTRPAGAQGSDPSSSSSSSMRRRKDTSHLQVLQGESQVFNASKSTDLFGLGVIKLEVRVARLAAEALLSV